MSLRIVSIAFITLFVLIFSGNIVFSEESSKEDKDFKIAWGYMDSGEVEKAQELFKMHYKPGRSIYSVSWLVLQSYIYLVEEKYDKALCVINEYRPILKSYYRLNAIKDKSEVAVGAKKLIKFNYKNMLITSGVANFKLENWLDALSDFLEETACGFGNNNYALKTVCFYHTKNYIEALINSKYAYKFAKTEIIKDEAAFNVAGLYSILDDVDQSIAWLKIPLKHNKDLWFPKIATEKDFDNVRNNYKFKKFIEEQMKNNKNEKT